MQPFNDQQLATNLNNDECLPKSSACVPTFYKHLANHKTGSYILNIEITKKGINLSDN
jgi:hypothetical protein